MTGFITIFTQVSHVEQALLTLSEHMRSPTLFSWGSCYSIFSFIWMSCRLLLVLSICFLVDNVLSVLLSRVSFGHCVVCPFVSCFFWSLCCLSFCLVFLLVIVLSVFLSRFFWSLCCLSFCPVSFGHCVVCPLIYDFWLPIWYLQTFLPFLVKWRRHSCRYYMWVRRQSSHIADTDVVFHTFYMNIVFTCKSLCLTCIMVVGHASQHVRVRGWSAFLFSQMLYKKLKTIWMEC